MEVRRGNKRRLVKELMAKNEMVREVLQEFTQDFMEGKEDILIDVMAKKISASKRQILYLFYILLRYLRAKENPSKQ